MFENHPIHMADAFSKKIGQPLEFQFARYIYVPQSSKDDREYFKVNASDLSARISSELANLKPLQEIAIQSKIEINGQCLHIPMLDLMSKFSETMIPGLTKLMSEFSVQEFWIYETGRSAHVYGLHPISTEQMISFFGKALLLNLPGKEPVVDSRWIGHRIFARNGSLRWSCNSAQYIQLPKKIGEFKA